MEHIQTIGIIVGVIMLTLVTFDVAILIGFREPEPLKAFGKIWKWRYVQTVWPFRRLRKVVTWKIQALAKERAARETLRRELRL